MAPLYVGKQTPKPSLTLVAHPEQDSSYMHFDVSFVGHPSQPAVTALPFDVTAAGTFSFVNAWWLAESALLSYWDAGAAHERFLDRAGLASELIDDGGTQCYVASNQAFTIVAFRGTQPNEQSDVWTDLDFVATPWEHGGAVHEGFKRGLDAVWDRLSKRLEQVPGDTVWFTGHSLGAALATLAADRFGNPAGVYTFGSPRVGMGDFVDGFDARHGNRSFRYSNNHDVVTYVPPSLLRYAHVRNERHIDGNGDIGAKLAGNGLSVITETVERFKNEVTKITSGASIVPSAVIDHTPRRYATFVWNAFVANVERV
jgi:hypothetical protein